MSEHNLQRDIDFAIRIVNGDYDKNDDGEIAAWLEVPDHRRLCREIMEYRARFSADEIGDDAYINVWRKVSGRVDAGKRRRRLFRISAAAAAVVIMGGVIFSTLPPRENYMVFTDPYDDYQTPTLIIDNTNVFQLDRNEKIAASDYMLRRSANVAATDSTEGRVILEQRLIVPHGYTHELVLADGTEVCLNAGSELIFPSVFDGTTREVTLRGEAFFNVARDEARPFIVRSNTGVQTRVYGTSFGVNTRGDESYRTLLVSGSVGVRMADGQEVMLAPLQMLSLDPKTNGYSVLDVTPDDYLGWRDNMFAYLERPLGDVLSDMCLWYGIKIRANAKNNDIKVTCSVRRDLSADEMMSFLETMLNVKFTSEGGAAYMME